MDIGGGHDHCYIRINVDIDSVDLNYEYRSFSVKDENAITGAIECFNLQDGGYCDIDHINNTLEHSWILTSGTTMIRTIDNNNDCGTYLVELILTDAMFLDSSGQTKFIDRYSFERVLVGYYIE